MKLVDIIKAVQSLNTTDQQRLLDFFTTNLKPFLTSEPIFNDILERKNADGYTCPHCSSKEVVRFGKYMVKVNSKDVERQRYRCKKTKGMGA
ncbi:hypothetical protein [Ureibacillus thermosphaericus]|uniref:Transposase-like protein n=1 Tax=Ureibacillus thermosphaericus TaxID=51173 RepID=A0A840PLY7_URETH|nr:hypothetical protein [Ureibacillus thermosphaericus]MBB5149425.1 transposase-like protein [Ureibacillus thermosphaericus]NKZ32189.1 hypothetical protein [Ureibacillus thermosphaericus]